MNDTVKALLPAALTLLFAFGAGFHTAASSQIWWLFAALGLAVVAFGRTALWRPFGPLVPAGLWISWWLAIVTSSALSEVPRAGWVGVLLVPLFLAVPGLAGSQQDRVASALQGVLLVVSGYGLAELVWRALQAEAGLAERAAMPLGHHNLLALFLLPLLMSALAQLLRGEGLRWLAFASFGMGSVALLATRSLSGALAYGVGVGFVLWRGGGARGDAEAAGSSSRGRSSVVPRLVAAAVVLGLLLSAPRALEVLAGQDSSASARWTYAQATWDGFVERPLFGHGPGSASWLLPSFMTPQLGINPAGEVVSDPHSMLLQSLFEMGLLGSLLLLLVVGVLVARLLREPPERTTGALAAVAAFGAMATVSGWFATPAVWIPLLVVVGTSIETEEPISAPWSVSALWVALSVALLWSPAWAHRHYDRAVHPETPDERAFELLRRSVDLDPDFSLYPFLLGRWNDESAALPKELLESQVVFALDRAARADRLGQGDPDALRSACRLDPIAPWAALLLSAHEEGLRSTQLAARAVALDPRLLAWSEFERAQVEQIASSIERDTRLPIGWRQSLLEDAGRLRSLGPREAQLAQAELWVDETHATSFSLFAFRRRPVPDVLVELSLDLDAVDAIRTPPLAAVAADVSRSFVDSALCAAPL